MPTDTALPTNVPPGSRRRLRMMLLGLSFVVGLVLAGVGAYQLYIRYIFVDHFSTVIPGVLYRSAWPRADTSWRIFKRYGITTIVNLTLPGDDPTEYQDEQEDVGKYGLNVVNMPMRTHVLELEQVRRFLQVVRSNKGASLVHCQYGKARTGIMVSSYRVVMQNWTPEHAVNEMMSFSWHPTDAHKQEVLNFLALVQNNREVLLAGSAPGAPAPTASSGPASGPADEES